MFSVVGAAKSSDAGWICLAVSRNCSKNSSGITLW